MPLLAAGSDRSDRRLHCYRGTLPAPRRHRQRPEFDYSIQQQRADLQVSARPAAEVAGGLARVPVQRPAREPAPGQVPAGVRPEPPAPADPASVSRTLTGKPAIGSVMTGREAPVQAQSHPFELRLSVHRPVQHRESGKHGSFIHELGTIPTAEFRAVIRVSVGTGLDIKAAGRHRKWFWQARKSGTSPGPAEPCQFAASCGFSAPRISCNSPE